MSDEPQYEPGGMSSRKPTDFRVPPRSWIVWIAIFGGLILLMLFRDRKDTEGELVPQNTFLRMVDSNQIARATINYSAQTLPLTEINGQYYRLDSGGKRLPLNDPHSLVLFHTKARLTERMEDKLFNLPQIEARQPNTMLLNLVWSVLPMLVIAVLIWFSFIARIKRV